MGAVQSMEDVTNMLTKPICLPNGKNHMAGMGPPPSYDPWVINVGVPSAKYTKGPVIVIDPANADIPQKALVSARLAQLSVQGSVGYGDTKPKELTFLEELEIRWLRLQLTLDVPGFPILFAAGGLTAAVVSSYFYLF